MTETPILDDSAVSEIEVRLSKFEGFEEAKALCATIRAGAEELAKAWKVADELRAENDRLSTGLMNLYHVITNEQCDRKVALGMATSAVSSLQSQLEQLRAENQRLTKDNTDLAAANRYLLKQNERQYQGEK